MRQGSKSMTRPLRPRNNHGGDAVDGGAGGLQNTPESRSMSGGQQVGDDDDDDDDDDVVGHIRC